MDNDDNIIDLATRIKQMRNLKPYRNKTDEELEAIIINKSANKKEPKVPNNKAALDDYDKRFNDKLEQLQAEYALDMNNSNDVEALKSLVRYQIQQENANRDIDAIQRKPSLVDEDYRSLKTLGDFQTGIARSINELQTTLGISRKVRKEKQQDDVPKFIASLLERGKEAFDTKTTKVECPRCMIELGRFWLNFPHLENEIQLSLTCWKCEEHVEYVK